MHCVLLWQWGLVLHILHWQKPLRGSQAFIMLCSGALPKHPCPQPNTTLEKGDDGAIPCTRVSALFSLGSSLLIKNQLKQNKGYELPSSQVLSEVGVGLASSQGSSETAFLLVPVWQKEVTNRSQADEVLRISPDTKRNKNKSVCLVCKANMDLVWWFWPYYPFLELLWCCWAPDIILRTANSHRTIVKQGRYWLGKEDNGFPAPNTIDSITSNKTTLSESLVSQFNFELI